MAKGGMKGMRISFFGAKKGLKGQMTKIERGTYARMLQS